MSVLGTFFYRNEMDMTETSISKLEIYVIICEICLSTFLNLKWYWEGGGGLSTTFGTRE